MNGREQVEDWHGTPGGNLRHLRGGSPTCAACRAAHAAYMREWRRRTGRTKGVLPQEGGSR